MNVREMIQILQTQDPDDEVIIDTDEGAYKYGLMYRGAGPDSVTFSCDLSTSYVANSPQQKLTVE